MYRHERERESETDSQKEKCFNETHNCCVMLYNHLSGLQARMEVEHECMMTCMTENTHTNTPTHTQWLSLPRSQEKNHATYIADGYRAMLTLTYGDTTQCAKQCCLCQEETLCSLGLKCSAGALFGNRAIHIRFDDLDPFLRSQVCQNHKLQIVFRFLSTVE